MEILRQLESLFLSAIPTVILVFLFYLFLRSVFFGPLMKAMAERRRRTEGARAEAQAAQMAAREKIHEYEQALKKARAGMYAEQEAARQAVLDERAKLVKEVRAQAHGEIEQAKKRIEQEKAATRAELEQQTPGLAEEIVRSILGQGAASARGAQ
jgi:F0F1-type ATP synthase membrane subunit b/b'